MYNPNSILKLNSKQKGVSEVISQVLVILIVTVVVGLIITTIMPTIASYNSRLRFKKAQNNITEINNAIIELNNKPINSKIEINLNLDKQVLFIDSNTNKIEISHIMKGNYFKENYIQHIDELRYNYKEGQKLISVLDYNSINILRTKEIENKSNVKLIITKKGKTDFIIDIEDLHDSVWFDSEYTSNEFSYSALDNNGEWLYRKAILINKNKIEDDLVNFPVLIDLNSDSDLYNYAKEDGSDILFTTQNGTKLEREIELFGKYTVYKKQITIDHTKVEGDLENFPILISLIDEDLKNYSSEFGEDIYFKDSKGNKLYREIEDFNKETGNLVVWVKIPQLSSTTDTNLDLYFGNPYIKEENSTEVWDGNYLIVQHFNENIINNTEEIKDSTKYDNDATPHNFNDSFDSGTINNGIISKSVVYDGIDDYFTSSDSNELYNNNNIEFSHSFWFRTDVIQGAYGSEGRLYNLHRYNLESTLISIYLGGSNDKGGPNKICVLTYSETTHIFNCVDTDPLYYDNNKHNIYLTYKDSNLNLYYDKKIIISETLEIGIAGTPPLYIGKFGSTSGGLFEGIIDEFRISNTEKTPEWIKTEYNNQNNPDGFYNISEKEIYKNTSKLVVWVNIPELTNDEDNLIYMYFGNNLTNEINSINVWPKDYILVQHLSQNSENEITIEFLDSTKYKNNGIAENFLNNNTSNTKTIGKIGFATLFGNNADYINIDNTSKDLDLLNKNFTIQCWIYYKGDYTQEYPIIGVGGHGGRLGWELYIDNYNNRSIFEITSNTRQYIYNPQNYNNQWVYLNITGYWNDNKLIIDNYINNQKISTKTIEDLDTIKSLDDDFRIGHTRYTNYFQGIIDEVRFSNKYKTNEWIKTEFNNQNNPNSFYSLGKIEYK